MARHGWISFTSSLFNILYLRYLGRRRHLQNNVTRKALTVLLIIGALLFLKPVMYMAFDRDFARSAGVNTTLAGYILSAITAVTIVLSIRVMGIILLISLMTLPVVIAGTTTKSYGKMTIYASVVAAFGALAGVIVSYYFEVPSGPAIIFVLTLVLIIVKLLSLQRKTATKS